MGKKKAVQGWDARDRLSERGTKRRTPGARCLCEACAPEVHESLKEGRPESMAPKKSPGREVSAQPGRVLVPEIGKVRPLWSPLPPVN